MVSRIFRWFDQHTWAGDAVLSTILVVPIVGAYLLAAGHATSWAAPVAFSMLAPLYLRRGFPTYVVVATVLVCSLRRARALPRGGPKRDQPRTAVPTQDIPGL